MSMQPLTRRRRAPRGSGMHLHDEILDAATQLLLETGHVKDVSIRAVAQRVGGLHAPGGGRGCGYFVVAAAAFLRSRRFFQCCLIFICLRRCLLLLRAIPAPLARGAAS